MSTINVTNLSGRNGSPNLPDGAVVTGVVTSTSAVIGSGVTINAGGLNVTGVISATSYVGSGSNLTGVGESIAPWYYNPDVNDSEVGPETGIGITFSKKVLAGSGTATIKIVNAGVAGTTIQSWGISSVTFPSTNVENITFGSLVSPLTVDQTYQLDIPSGFIVDSTDTSYAGTAYTFSVMSALPKAFKWGNNAHGTLGQNDRVRHSSPVQIGAAIDNTWTSIHSSYYMSIGVKEDNTLYVWGYNEKGQLGQNQSYPGMYSYSSPTQLGSGTDWSVVAAAGRQKAAAVKTDGTLWSWGYNNYGFGGNDRTDRSSPIQIPGTTWPKTRTNDNIHLSWYRDSLAVIKTDGTLWTWGHNGYGLLGHNNTVQYSSPVQVPGTTWKHITCNMRAAHSVKTDGTLWSWGYNEHGDLGQNAGGPGAGGQHMSSPVQIPGTTWKHTASAAYGTMATRTDGTLWSWGQNTYGQLGLNNRTSYSSPTQIPGTSWDKIGNSIQSFYAIKTDGTLWSWGQNSDGKLGLGTEVLYSSPVQIGSETDWSTLISSCYGYTATAMRTDATP